MPFSPIKTAIRQRFGSIIAFEDAKGLRRNAVRDHLRGRSCSAAEGAILAEFGRHELEQPRLKHRRRNPLMVDLAGAEQLCEQRLEELASAIERAEEARQQLQQLLKRSR